MNSFIIIEQGTPYEKGAFISIECPRMIVGRKVMNATPDIAFDNIFVSRNHLEIYSKDGFFFIRDLYSKHGTTINNKQINPNEEIQLKHLDKISIATGLIKFSFSTYNIEQTADFTGCIKNETLPTNINLHSQKHELILDNYTYKFSEKEYKCIELLVNNRDIFVTTDEIKAYVWNERKDTNHYIPDVSIEEINTLIYRIRKKTKDIFTIENTRGKGFSLSLIHTRKLITN
ncbi:FHA domain-containing protein [Bacillus sp. FJAT-45350]|uniref:FHA domain-containing protein n=1 Tax=Bacillus sp. FJAT-45350 TaxID=2011014 RepID=UPI000BB935A2|nr:FHA domain-containing protein [Bacillus sp. FJAT-45350]